MLNRFNGFADRLLPAVAQMLDLEPDEYADQFNALRDRSRLARTPGDLEAIAQAVNILLDKWRNSVFPSGDDIHEIIHNLQQCIDVAHNICVNDPLLLVGNNPFLTVLGAAVADLLSAMETLLAWMSLRLA